MLKLVIVVLSLALAKATTPAPTIPVKEVPEIDCKEFLPQGRSLNQAQGGVCPFSLLTVRTSFTTGDKVTVTLVGKRAFLGFQIQARNVETHAVVGTWYSHTDNDHRVKKCVQDGDSITHLAIPIADMEKEFIWQSPSVTSGSVEFVATIISWDGMRFWHEIKSAQVIEMAGEVDAEEETTPRPGQSEGENEGTNTETDPEETEPTYNREAQDAEREQERQQQIRLEMLQFEKTQEEEEKLRRQRIQAELDDERRYKESLIKPGPDGEEIDMNDKGKITAGSAYAGFSFATMLFTLVVAMLL